LNPPPKYKVLTVHYSTWKELNQRARNTGQSIDDIIRQLLGLSPRFDKWHRKRR